MKELIIQESGEVVYNYLRKYIDFEDNKNLFLSTTTKFNIDKQPDNHYKNIINLKRINDFRRINKVFEAVNAKLPVGGLYINAAETYHLRKMRILKKYPAIINYFVYFMDWVFKRLFPKVFFLKKIYFFITKGRNRVISKAETFGRLYSCGFEIVDTRMIGHLQYFVVRKIKDPEFDYNPTYGPYIKLRRIGKNGNFIKVYKLRTMHAYSEYLQDYVFQKSNLEEGGKFKNDFRITTLGKFLRKFWLDELPMLFNILKGELKLFGVRPLSEHYFNLYNEDLRKRRIRYKPGLIPPFYVHMPKTLEEIMDSERKYLDEYEKAPFRTDWKYFWKAFYNIVFKNARSK
jgi:lipopolysaccharide/colanic/teichoic acid biosynthesis glycosyltransferase